MRIICDYGYLSKDEKKIYCKINDNLCGHVKMCQLNMKWTQTKAAEGCTLPKKEEK